MFGKKNNKKAKTKAYKELVSDLAYSTVYDALYTILNTDVKKVNNDGKEVTDCGLTISKIKMTARMALDFVANLTKENKT